jgi:hypothetical protein
MEIIAKSFSSVGCKSHLYLRSHEDSHWQGKILIYLLSGTTKVLQPSG